MVIRAKQELRKSGALSDCCSRALFSFDGVSCFPTIFQGKLNERAAGHISAHHQRSVMIETTNFP